jgi:hypothetical protein
MAQLRALVARLHAGEVLTPDEAERLAVDALALQRRLERLRALAPEVEVELDPTLAAFAARAERSRLVESDHLDRAAALAPA